MKEALRTKSGLFSTRMIIIGTNETQRFLNVFWLLLVAENLNMMDGRLAILRFYILFNSISVISG